MSRNLAICMTRTMTIYFLAWVREFGAGMNFDLVVSNGHPLPERYIDLLARNGVICVDAKLAQEKKYEKIVLSPYEGFASHKNLLAKFHFEHIVYFSDGLRNGMFSFPKLDHRASELVYFGFELFEQAFDDNLMSNQHSLPRFIVPVETIRRTWCDLLDRYPENVDSPIMQKNDLLIAMRHWGNQPHYTFREDNLHDYLQEELVGLQSVGRVIYKAHPWMPLDLDIKIRMNLQETLNLSGDIELVFWENLFETNSEFPELSSPEAEFWKSSHELGFFYGFDSSLNNLVKLRCSSAKLIYPSENIYKKYFEFEKSVHLVSEQINWQKDLADQIEQGFDLSTVKIFTGGLPYEKLIIEIPNEYREVLMQERDALTQERDALTQERDALTNSTIWRVTRFARVLVSFLNKIR